MISLTPIFILTSPIWLTLVICVVFSKLPKLLIPLSCLASLPHILLIGAMGIMLFDAPGSENNPTAWLFYFGMVFGPPAIAVTIAGACSKVK